MGFDNIGGSVKKISVNSYSPVNNSATNSFKNIKSSTSSQNDTAFEKIQNFVYQDVNYEIDNDTKKEQITKSLEYKIFGKIPEKFVLSHDKNIEDNYEGFLEQLKENIEIFHRDYPQDIFCLLEKEFDDIGVDIVMPSLWKK